MARKRAGSAKKKVLRLQRPPMPKPKPPIPKPPMPKPPMPKPKPPTPKPPISKPAKPIPISYPVELPPWTADDLKCTPPNICKFLDALSAWLHQKFIPDYTALRIAVCNVEKKAFTNTGINSSPPKFCVGGPANEPADPPKPPVW